MNNCHPLPLNNFVSSSWQQVSVQIVVEEANAEYTMLVASNRWCPQGKQDPSGAPEAIFTKAELNTLVQ